MRSFADPSTEFYLPKSGTPPSVDGLAIHERTGEVVCPHCWESDQNIDEIPHAESCPQRFVHSEWYAEAMQAD